MRRFQITTPNVKEPITVVYDDRGLLSSFSVFNAGLNDKQVSSFKSMVPVKLDDITTAFAEHKSITVVEVDFVITFDMFWDAYDKKINAKRSRALWDKMSKSKQVQAWHGVAAYDKFLKAQTWGRAKADPDTYLRQEYWENEYK